MTLYDRQGFSSKEKLHAFDARLPDCPMYRNASTDHFECRSILDLRAAGVTVESLPETRFGAYAAGRSREDYGFFLAAPGRYESAEHTHTQCAAVPCSGRAAERTSSTDRSVQGSRTVISG